MAVTITPSANSALSSELLLSGTLLIENAKDDGTETLAVSVYNKNTGATFTGTAQVYDTSKTTLTYTYANGTNFSVNLGTGNWVYQRLSTEVGNTVYTYIITFVWADSDGNISKTLTIETRENIIVNSFTANPLDDLDETITGVCDIDIINASSVKVSIEINANSNVMTGSEKILATSSDIITWNFIDSTSFSIDFAKKVFLYNRNASSVGDNSPDTYLFILTINGIEYRLNVISNIGFAPSVTSIGANSTDDTNVYIDGYAYIANASSSNIAVNVTHNGVLYKGETKIFANSIQWDYPDGSVFAFNALNNTWRYTRVAADTQDLLSDVYAFELLINNKYGSDSAQVKIQTTIPKATIVAFTADNISDTEKKIIGVLKFELPSIANNPTIRIDTSVNGIIYRGNSTSLKNTVISFEYTNGSALVVDAKNGTFTYSRASDDYANADADVYSFDCSIGVNGEVVSQNLTVKSIAGQRFYDYEPAYPINVQPGSVETQRTAWTKYVEENKRLYRLLNENLNYYENIAISLNEAMDELRKWSDSKFSQYDSKMEELRMSLLAKINEMENVILGKWMVIAIGKAPGRTSGSLQNYIPNEYKSGYIYQFYGALSNTGGGDCPQLYLDFNNGSWSTNGYVDSWNYIILARKP